MFQRQVRRRHRLRIEQVSPRHRIVAVGDQRSDVVQAHAGAVHRLGHPDELDVRSNEPVGSGLDDLQLRHTSDSIDRRVGERRELFVGVHRRAMLLPSIDSRVGMVAS